MPTESNDILEFNQYMKSDKMPYIIDADIESLIKKQIGIWGFDRIENKRNLYHGKDYMKNL